MISEVSEVNELWPVLLLLKTITEVSEVNELWPVSLKLLLNDDLSTSYIEFIFDSCRGFFTLCVFIILFHIQQLFLENILLQALCMHLSH